MSYMMACSLQGSKTFSWGAEGDPQELARDAGNAPKADLAHRFARVSQWTEIESYYFVDDESTNFSLVKARNTRPRMV